MLSLLFFLGAIASSSATVLLLWPGSSWEEIWRLNPRAQVELSNLGGWGVGLMSAVCVACAAAAIGLWRGARWGYWLAIVLLTINLVSDLLIGLLGDEPWTLVGVPVALGILFSLRGRRVKQFFAGSRNIESEEQSGR